MDNKILVKYLIETPGEPEQIAQTLARNQSTGTFTAVPTSCGRPQFDNPNLRAWEVKLR